MTDYKLTTAWDMAAVTAPMIWVQYKEGDIPTTTTREAAQISSMTRPTTSPVTSVMTSPTGANDGGLTTGAKAGIGIGVVAGVLAVLGILLFYCLRGRRKADAATSRSVGEAWHDSGPATSRSVDEAWKESELETQVAAHEMPADMKFAEMSTEVKPSELPVLDRTGAARTRHRMSV